ncbi:MAG: hypothetical protein HYS21_10965 [Deltaproteobacteria bacterium]|nr:hypothetical protein [Deltaproteobacteria bacterium]
MVGFTSVLMLVLAFTLALPLQGYAKDINWSKIDSARVVLFYPGVTSWEFLTSDDHRLGGREIKQGKKDCRHCHLSKEGELDLKADEIAAGSVKMKRSHNPFEPEPLAGKKGVAQAKFQAAYDDEFLYLRVEWDSKGGGWNRKSPNNSSVPDRVSLQINKTESTFKKYGCFITCHNDLNTMPLSPQKRDVSAHPYYKSLDRSDVRLYANYAKASWDEKRNDKDLEKKLKEGGRIDLRAVEFEGGSAKALDGWIFDDRIWENKSADATGQWASGKYSAVFKARLKSKDAFDIQVNEGDVISVGIAIHEENTAKRKHYVSFPYAIGLGTNGDIKASRISN